MKKFGTEYRAKGVRHFAHVWARDTMHAITLCVDRGLDEHLAGYMTRWVGDYPTASHLLRTYLDPARKSPRLVDVVHTLIWTADLTMAAGVGTREDTIADQGWFHVAIHWINLAGSLTQEDIERAVRPIELAEERIPGYLENPHTAPSGQEFTA